MSDSLPSKRLYFGEHLQPGQLLAGRYQILNEIGRGGMSVVYKIEHVFLGQIFALKILRSIDKASLVRFQREAKLCQKLSHKNLISVTDSGLAENGDPFLIMEFAEGEALSQRLKRDVRIDWRECVDLFIEICNGLRFLHDNGVVHRDIKPSNFMLCNSGDTIFDSKQEIRKNDVDRSNPKNRNDTCVKIIDFGIAGFSHESEENHSVTRTGDVFGSPLFMSPEQCAGKHLDHRSDIYSLGCAFFQCLTGESPFSQDNAIGLMMQHRSQQIPTLRERLAIKDIEMPAALEKTIPKLLAKDPAMRYQSVFAFQNDLRKIKEGGTLDSRPLFAKKRFLVTVSVLFTLILVTSGLVISNITKPKNVKNEPLHDSFVELAHAQPKHIEATSKPFYSAEPWAEARDNHRPLVFEFPSESIGEIGPDLKSLRHATGTTVFEKPAQMVFLPNPLVTSQPGLLTKFRPLELKTVQFSAMMWGPPVDDDVARCIAKLPSLRNLRFPESEITDRGLQSLNSLTSLESLIVDRSIRFTPKALTSAVWFHQLTLLRAAGLQGDITPIVNGVKDSKVLETLDLSFDDITDKDLGQIANCATLQDLQVAGSKKVTNAGLKSLASAKSLISLNVRHCSVTPASIRIFASFKKLERLYLTLENWSPSEVEALRDALPNCFIGLNPPGKFENADRPGAKSK